VQAEPLAHDPEQRPRLEQQRDRSQSFSGSTPFACTSKVSIHLADNGEWLLDRVPSPF